MVVLVPSPSRFLGALREAKRIGVPLANHLPAVGALPWHVFAARFSSMPIRVLALSEKQTILMLNPWKKGRCYFHGRQERLLNAIVVRNFFFSRPCVLKCLHWITSVEFLQGTWELPRWCVISPWLSAHKRRPSWRYCRWPCSPSHQLVWW